MNDGMDEDALLDALLGIEPPATSDCRPPPVHYRCEIDNKSTTPFVGRRCYGGYKPPVAVVPVFALPEKPVEAKHDLGMARIQQRAKDKRDARIKKQLKKNA